MKKRHATPKVLGLISSLSLIVIAALVLPRTGHTRAPSPSLTTQDRSSNESGFNVSPAGIDFGYQLVSTRGSQRQVTLIDSSATPIVISGIDAIGNNRADFIPAYDFSLPLTLGSGESATIELSFLPLPPWSKGTRDAKLKIKTDDGDQFVTLTGIGATCAGPVSSCESAGLCADTDGDGFNDVWEDNDYIDLNNNGKEDNDDFHFPHRASHIFSPVSKTGTGQGQMFPTVIDPSVPVKESSVVVTVTNTGNLNEAEFTYTINGSAPVGPIPIRPIVNISDNLRFMFYLNNFVTGDTYTFTTSMGQNVKLADRDVPNIYVQYDYMDWAAPGGACNADSDCANPNDICHQGSCNHNHAPGDPLFRKVVDQFAAHGITLYIDPIHNSVPHAQVVTWSQQGDGTNGGLAVCAGADVVRGNIGPGQAAVNFHDIKYRPGFDFAAQPARKNIYHYAVLGHLNTCLTDDPGAAIGYCGQCPADRSTPSGFPFSGSSGLAELPGNDFIVSLGDRWYVSEVARTPFDEQGVFMHELGHNLGLHHAGDSASPDLAPNYLSVMNNKYVFSGIQHAAVPGSTVSVESLRELDYSEHTLNFIDEAHLDEQAGVSPLSAGYTGIIRFFNFRGGNGLGPESGPIDWDGFPSQSCATDADCESGQLSFSGKCLASGVCEVRADLNKNDAWDSFRSYADWIHGPCTSSTDCRVNNLRLIMHDLFDPSLDPHESCVRGRCQSLWFPYQCTLWGKTD